MRWKAGNLVHAVLRSQQDGEIRIRVVDARGLRLQEQLERRTEQAGGQALYHHQQDQQQLQWIETPATQVDEDVIIFEAKAGREYVLTP